MWRVLLCVLTPALALAAEAAPASHPADGPLNVLLIVSDDHVHSAMGCSGNPAVRTPNLDRLADSGVRFSHAFVTVPICTPSRAAFLTGTCGARNGVTFFGKKIPADMPTLPKVLAERGYQTAVIGKWHNVRGFEEYGFRWSRNVFVGGMGPYWDPMLVQKPGDKPTVVKGQATELFTEAAIGFLREHDPARPFLLYVAYTAPHDPRTPPPDYERQYDPAKIQLPGNFKTMPQPDPGTLGIRDEKLLPLPRDPAAVRREIARYYAQISHLDVQIGRVLAALEESGLTSRTLVIFAGDNGLALGAHGLLGKQTLHEEGVRVPLIMRNPRLKTAGQTRDALVCLADLLPTICDWTGVKPPPELDGRSLTPVYDGSKAGVRDAIFARYDERDQPMFRSVRTQRYKLIRYVQLGIEELYDLRNDPLELKSLTAEPAMASVLADLRGRLDTYCREQEALEAARKGRE